MSQLHSALKYPKLARVSAWPGYSLAFVIPFAAGAYYGTSWVDASMGFVSLLLFAGFAFALNFYSDRDTDSYHDGVQKDCDLARQPMVTGAVSERGCRVFCTVTLALSLALAFAVSGLFGLIIVLACLFGGVLYSHPRIRLKAKPVGDVFCISVLGILVPSAGYLLGRGALPTPLMMLFWFMVTATGYLATVASDYDFDARAGLRTSAVVFGQRRVLKAMTLLGLACLGIAYLMFDGPYPYPVGTRYFAALMGAALVAFVIIVWRSLKPPKMHVPVLSSWGRWVFAVPALVSIVLVYWTYLRLLGSDYLPSDPFWQL